jgi:hypothetical protein
VLEDEQRTIVDSRRARAEASGVAEGIPLLLDDALLLLPLNAEWRVGQHVVEGDPPTCAVAVEGVIGERVAAPNVVGVSSLDQQV